MNLIKMQSHGRQGCGAVCEHQCGVCFLRASRSSPLTESVGGEVDRLVGKQNVRVLVWPCHRPTGRPPANPGSSLGLSVPLCTI